MSKSMKKFKKGASKALATTSSCANTLAYKTSKAVVRTGMVLGNTLGAVVGGVSHGYTYGVTSGKFHAVHDIFG